MGRPGLAVAVVATLGGCRFHFDLLPADAARSDGDSLGDGGSRSDGALVTCPGSYEPLAGQASRYRLAVAAPWLMAEQACEADGTHLTILGDDAERTAVVSLAPGSDMWMGVSDRLAPGTFMTVTGAPASYLPWGTGQPSLVAGELCVRLVGSSSGFEDKSCSSSSVAVCECDGVPADPASY